MFWVLHEIGEGPVGNITNPPYRCYIDHKQTTIQQSISVMFGVMGTVSCWHSGSIPYLGMRVAYQHNGAEDVAVGPSFVLGYCRLVRDVKLVFRGMLECCSHGDLDLRASTTSSRIEQRSELRVHLEDGLLLRDSAGRETVLGDTVSNLDASVSSDVAVRRQLESPWL